MDIDTIINRLTGVDDIAERWALLDSICGDDAEKRLQVLKLLDSRQLSVNRDDLPTKPAADGTTIARADDLIGQRLGNYEIVELLGEGGMGVVYLARQEHPVKRRVAVKITKAGATNAELTGRFHAERQALALMDHDNIAKVFDAGATDDGRLYLVMELVEGIPIIQYCRDRASTIVQRLELIKIVCRAIQHAHQKGVLHRDIKPSNILIIESEGGPILKVIDFGLAKALEQPLGPQTLHTQHGQVLGTLEYMSPEQASFASVDVDTRSDVYSLGVLLYELLTGVTPIGRQRVQSLEFEQLLKVIRDEEAQRPSTRLSEVTYHEAGHQISNHSVSALRDRLRGDLDLISLKALAKDRERRYETPMALAADIDRFLHDQPIEARAPSAIYLMRKFTRRNRAFVGGLVAVAAALSVGIAASTYFAIDANREAARAIRARQDESKARREAETSAKRSVDVLDVVTDAFESVDPNSGGDQTMSAKDVLVNAKKSMAASDLDDAGRLQLSRRLATCLASLGEYQLATESAQEALNLCRKIYGDQHEQTRDSLSLLGRLHVFNGDLQQAVMVLEKARSLSEALSGAADLETMRVTGRLAAAYSQLGQPEKAVTLSESTLKGRQEVLGPTHPETLSAMNDLSVHYTAIGRVDDGLDLAEQTVDLMQGTYGEDHPETLTAMDTLAGAYESVGRYEEAIVLYRRELDLLRAKMGENHPDTLLAMNNLGYAYESTDQLEEALTMFQAALHGVETQLGEEHPFTITAINNLAGVHRKLGGIETATSLRERAFRLAGQHLGTEHPHAIVIAGSLARLYLVQQRYDDAVATYEPLYETCKNVLGPDHPTTAMIGKGLAESHFGREEPDKAAVILGALLPVLEQTQPEHWLYFDTQSQYGGVLLSMKRLDDADPLLRGGFEGLVAVQESIPSEYRARLIPAALKRLVQLAESRNQPDQVEKWQRELEALP